MTYSQLSTNLSNSSDIAYLEYQIEGIREELKQAKITGQQTLIDAATEKLAELETELADLEE